MSHTAHARGRGTRYARRATWERAFCGHAARPARAERRRSRLEIELELLDMQLVSWDPEVLLWGGMLADDKIARERDQNLRRGLLTRGPGTQGWDAWDDYTYWYDSYLRGFDYWYDDYGCGACDSGCACAMARYAEDDYRDYLDGYDDGGRWDQPDIGTPGGRDAWVDGQIEAPRERDSYDEILHDDYPDYEYELIEQEERGLDGPTHLADLRDRERQAASRRGRRRSARRR